MKTIGNENAKEIVNSKLSDMIDAYGSFSARMIFSRYLGQPINDPGTIGTSDSSQIPGQDQVPQTKDPSSTLHLKNTLFNLDPTLAPQNEESIAVRSTDPGQIVGGANDYRGIYFSSPTTSFPFDCLSGYYVSTDGGSTTLRDGCLPEVTGTLGTLAATLEGSGDPSLDSDNLGHIFYADLRIDSSFTFTGLGITRSSSGLFTAAGTPWETPKLVAVDLICGSPLPPPGLTCIFGQVFHDKEWVAVDKTTGLPNSGRVYVTWTTFGPTFSNIYVSRCENDLSFCTTPQPISSGTTKEHVQGSYPVVDSRGRLMVVWRSFLPNQAGDILMRVCQPSAAFTVSADCGPIITVHSTTGLDFILPNVAFRTPTFPKLAVGDLGGTLRAYVAWNECTVPNNLVPLTGSTVNNFPCVSVDVFLSRFDLPACITSTSCTPVSIDAAPRQVNRISEGQHYFPHVSTDSARPGIVNLVWYDTQGDSTGRQYRVHFAQSHDGGDTFDFEHPVTPVTDPSLNGFLGDFFIGDYFQMISKSGTAYIHYTANFVSKGSPPLFDQDNFLAKITY